MSIADTVRPSSAGPERIPLSLNQEFLCLLDKGEADGPFGPRYNMVVGFRISGKIDIDILRAALGDVVARHESLRTMVVRDAAERYQRILAPSVPALSVRDLEADDARSRDQCVEQFLNELEAAAYDVSEMPLLRAVVGRFDAEDAVLALIVHHSATDQWSMQVILRDLAICYANRKGTGAPALPEAAQYQEFARWERANQAAPATESARAYWRTKLRDAQFLAVRTDRPRTAEPSVYSAHRFLLDEELTTAVVALSRRLRCSPFMVFYAAFNVLLGRMLDATDIVVATMTPGRNKSRFQNTVGSFFNFLPLRTDIARCATFHDVVKRVRQTCIEAYSKELPFVRVVAEAPDLMRPMADADRALCAFQVLNLPMTLEDELFGDLKYTEIRRRLRSQPVASVNPDGLLWTLDLVPSGDIVGTIRFNRNHFAEPTITKSVREFVALLRDFVTAPDSSLERSRI